MSPSSFRAYQYLLDDEIDYLSQSFGETGNRALAFVPRPSCRDPKAAITRCLNLFANYDPRPRSNWGEYPAPLRTCNCYDITYINVTQHHLMGVLTNYFESVLPKELGNRVYTNELAEDGPDITFSYDENEVKSLAAECARHFIDNEIKVRVFMPEYTVVLTDTYAFSPQRSAVEGD